MPQELQDEASTPETQVDQDAPSPPRQGDDRRLESRPAVRQAKERAGEIRSQPGGGHDESDGEGRGDQETEGTCLHEDATGWEGREGEEEGGGQEGRSRGGASPTEASAGTGRRDDSGAGRGGQERCEGRGDGEDQRKASEQVAGGWWGGRGDGSRLIALNKILPDGFRCRYRWGRPRYGSMIGVLGSLKPTHGCVDYDCMNGRISIATNR